MEALPRQRSFTARKAPKARDGGGQNGAQSPTAKQRRRSSMPALGTGLRRQVAQAAQSHTSDPSTMLKRWLGVRRQKSQYSKYGVGAGMADWANLAAEADAHVLSGSDDDRAAVITPQAKGGDGKVHVAVDGVEGDRSAEEDGGTKAGAADGHPDHRWKRSMHAIRKKMIANFSADIFSDTKGASASTTKAKKMQLLYTKHNGEEGEGHEEPRYILRHDLPARQIWDFVTTLLVLYLCWRVPVGVSLHWWLPPEGLKAFELLMDIWPVNIFAGLLFCIERAAFHS